MNKLIDFLIAGFLVLICSSFVYAGEYRYWLGDVDDLDHYSAYSRKIDTDNFQYLSGSYSTLTEALDKDEEIDKAYLYFNDITNNVYGDNILWLSVLDMDASDTSHEFADDQAWGDFFNGSSTEYDYDTTSIGSWTDTNGTYFTNTFTFDITGDALASLDSWIQDGIFGLGFDPDCHFTNDYIKLYITTKTKITPPGGGDAVPEPATLFLFGVGLLGAASRMRKKTRA